MALDVGELARAWIEIAGAVLSNGTQLSTTGVFEASMTAARWCKAAGGRVIFDIDYRPVLWGLTERDMGENRFVAHDAVTARLQQVLPLCDLIVGTEEEIHILGGDTDTIAARSEEHTSELQSLMRISYAVFCLKKKIKITSYNS